ncbi:MAG TPA: hypothetical protein ENK02_15875 [Planctomycetes bacterium]|nr:hypothetical protein [Planctomycetota bacterium]
MTKILQANPSQEQELLARLRAALDRGGLVILPTETVYGIAARADRPQAMDRLRALKEREGPFTLHLGDTSQVPGLAEAPVQARRLAKNYWPGPLTMILEGPKHGSRAGGIGAGQSLGYRVVDHPWTGPFLRNFEGGLVMSSANRQGRPAPRSLEDLDPAVLELADLALDHGPCQSGIASTVLRVGHQGSIRILRSGLESKEQFLARAATLHLFVCTGNTCRSPMAALLYHQHLATKLGVSPDSLLEHGHLVSSAGISAQPGMPASPRAIEAMAELGLDLSYHRSRFAHPTLLVRASRIYCMGQRHLDLVRQSLEGMGGSLEEDARPPRLLRPEGDIPDPFGGDLGLYVETREALRASIEGLE